jgi:MFS family permease
VLLAGWLVIGVGYSTILTPSGRLLKRSAHPEDRPAVYAAQFALSHACWLVTYPLAGWLMTVAGAATAFVTLAVLAAIGLAGALVFWPNSEAEVLQHTHENLAEDHPHVRHGRSHAHPYIIDDHHPHWPPVTKAGYPNTGDE